jgi:hypothetical protein
LATSGVPRWAGLAVDAGTRLRGLLSLAVAPSVADAALDGATVVRRDATCPEGIVTGWSIPDVSECAGSGALNVSRSTSAVTSV